jgi:prevent-host-death family protein
VRKVSVREARAELAALLDAVVAGEDVVITRRGKPVARLTLVEPARPDEIAFPSRRAMRDRMPPSKMSSTQVIRQLRDERG